MATSMPLVLLHGHGDRNGTGHDSTLKDPTDKIGRDFRWNRVYELLF